MFEMAPQRTDVSLRWNHNGSINNSSNRCENKASNLWLIGGEALTQQWDATIMRGSSVSFGPARNEVTCTRDVDPAPGYPSDLATGQYHNKKEEGLTQCMLGAKAGHTSWSVRNSQEPWRQADLARKLRERPYGKHAIANDSEYKP